MCNRFRFALAGLLAIAAFVRPVRAEIDAEQVSAAIDNAVRFLKEEQSGGQWVDHNGQPGGVTALATLALLNAGVDPASPEIQSALAYLRSPQAVMMTYSVALQTMVFATAEPKKDLLLIRRNAKWLESAQIKSGERAGSWSYQNGGGGDNSNAQFALLGLHEAERAGVTISPKTWRLALDYWQKTQNPDGSWGYQPGQAGTGSMTCAGIASVIIAAGALNAGDATVAGGRVQCCGQQQGNRAVDNAMAWLERNFTVHSNPGPRNSSWVLYYLYGVERTGRMTNRRFIGKHDWYREGSEMLVRSQTGLGDGSWRGSGVGEDHPHIGTSLALLFLAKGRRPVLVGKLKHGPADDWNHHRSDLANLTSYVEQKWKKEMTWQIIDPAAASVEDLLQAPVLFFNGREAPQFTAEQKKNLRDYVDRGGFIFAEACCQGGEFDTGFRKLMTEVFSESEHKLRLLPQEHPVWHAEEVVDPKYVRPLWGIDVGCRTSVVYCPQDLSCYWELARVGRSQPLPAAVQAETAAVQAIGINVLAYATNRELKYKYEFKTPNAAGTEDPIDRGTLHVAKLQHPGGCNIAPGALTNLMRVAGDKLKIRVSSEPRDVAMTDKAIFNYHLVFMHGRHNFRLTPAERKQLRTYLERGGMLFADAICSSKEFNDSFRKEMKAIFADKPLERIPPDHAMFTPELGGADLSTLSLRSPQGGETAGPIKASVRKIEPYLEGIKIGDRYAVIHSRYDLSCALENHESLECEGYTREDAARLGLNVLLYSLHQ